MSANCRSAVRLNPLCEFNNAIVMSHRPLKDDELFEVIVEKLVSRWSGSMEAGLYHAKYSGTLLIQQPIKHKNVVILG